MSMIMQYVRIQPEELRRLRQLLDEDPNGAYDYVDELADADRWRSLDTDRAWAGLSFLLDRAGPPPVDVIHGAQQLTDDEWGYGPPRWLDVKEVALGSEFLSQTPFDALVGHFDHAAMRGIYPDIWNEPDALGYLRGVYREQCTFFRRAAAMGDGLVVYLT